jgi:hypothetical protein
MPQSSAELAKKFGGAPTTADLAAQFGGKRADTPEAAPESTQPRTWLDDVKDFAVGLWNKQPIHPIDIATGTADAIRHPVDTASGVLKAQGVPLTRAEEAFKRGDYAAGVADVLNYLVPIIGPQISDAQDRTRRGEQSLSGLAGESVGIGLQAALPEAAKRLPPVTTKPLVPNLNAAEREAVGFAEQRGIPMDAATASGNRVVRGVQNVADRSLGGAVVSERAKTAQQAGLARVGGEIAADVNKSAVTPYQAGEGTLAGVDASMGRHAQDANKAYDALRAIEADPAQTKTVKIRVQMTDTDGKVTTEVRAVPMQMPVDLRASKAALRPIYDRMMRQMPVAQQRADPALHAIKNILDAPDYLPASMVDTDLSAIKALARTDGPRDVSQGLAAASVRTLDNAVRAAVKAAGPDAERALTEGRAATQSKYRAADVLKQLRDEPRQVFDQATWANDAGIDRLKAVARESPQSMPQIGRAYLDDLLAKATAEGGFEKAASLQSSWEKLGPQTKALLFKPQHIKDLDNFFLVAKKMAENPNPSGTAYVTGLGAQGALLVTNPITGAAVTLGLGALSKLLHSPFGVRAVTRGLSIPLASRASATSAYAGLLSAAKQEGVTLTPAVADSEAPSETGPR